MKNLSKKNGLKVLLIVAICITLITGLGTTYAFFVYRENGSNVSLEGGEVKVTFVNDNNYLNTGNSYPVSDETGKILPYYSDFSVNATTDKVDIKYEIQLIPDEGNTLDSKYIKVYLTDQDDNPLTNVLYYNELHDAEYNENAKVVYTSYFKESGTKDFRLRIWIDESYNVANGQTFGFKINLYAVNGKANFLSDKIEDTLPLTESDIDGTRYVYGQTEDNYLWYSGKLWRIVSINGDGSIKLVTQGNMTSIAWHTSENNTDYSTSQVRRWLNNEFLPTLYDANNLLVDSTWDYTTYTDATATKVEPVNFIENEKVGLLTIYDYFKVNNGSNSNFLNNGYYWWTMSPQTDSSSVWYISYNSLAEHNSLGYGYGVRPSVNLKSDIQIMGGDGTKSAPYIIGGDKDTGVTSELLNNRISGEYINFNNILYRIVGIEEINGQKLTKVTMADYSVNNNAIGSVAFGGSTNELTYSTTYGIGLYLENWYQSDGPSETYATTYIKDNYKAMIASAEDCVTWYTGPSTGALNDYTLSETGISVSATIGLGYYGEMFSSQFGDGYGSSGTNWLMTRIGNWYIFSVRNHGLAIDDEIAKVRDVRPSFYLKSDVKITGGSGMPNDPYELEYEPKKLSEEVEEKLTLTSADSDCNRYVTGSNPDNYLWYSGKLWRIVSVNCDGSVKLVTQGNMTTIAWDTSETNTNYSTSQVGRWLNNEFLPTLANADTLLADSTWDYTTYSSFPTAKLKTTSSVKEKVGLLNIYEYMMTGGTNSSSTSNTFLNNGYYMWTMSPRTSGSYVWTVANDGSVDYYTPANGRGVRPSVNLKSDIQIMGGYGTKSNPYVIGGDKATGTFSELLSNRISGEYIKFNNTLYRIVGTEVINGQKLTKITMADYSVNSNTLTTSQAFGASSSDVTYNTSTGIGKYLLDWYNGSSINSTYKAMIATATEDKIEWYTGPTSGTSNDYTLAKTGTPVSATIGLGYYGEMFSSQFGDGNGSSTYIWLMTIYSSSDLRFVNSDGRSSYGGPTNNLGVRPSFYLKSNVKITGGNGQQGNPYEISQ